MRKTRCLAELCSQVPTSWASSSLERIRPSTHRGGQHGAGGSLARMAAASRARGLVDLALRGSLGQFFLRQLHQG